MSLLSGSCPRATARQLISLSRSFSTTPAVLNVPPESPSYIRLPTPPQSDEKKLPRVRGHLPVPREVFPRIEGNRKVRPDYISQTAPKPAEPRKPENETQAWKMKMANTRRGNLEKGLKDLWARREKSDRRRNARVSQKFEEHNRAARAPERKDDVLTRSTVLDSVLDTQVYIDPDRFRRAEKSYHKTLAVQNSKREARRDALMELYINASSFIVNENELKAEIENVFSEDFFKKQGQTMGRYGNAENTWDVHGKPPSIANMLEDTTGTSTKIMDIFESEYDRSVKRQKRIAEEFTGGKME
ncbi:Fc.00g004410.m01.CDS01 [Cosmosporella sp. VM-42]